MADNRDWLSGRKNLPEILLGYHQYRGAITSTAVVIYFGEWIKNANPINLIVLLLLSHIIYIGIRCYVKDWMEERGYY